MIWGTNDCLGFLASIAPGLDSKAAQILELDTGHQQKLLQEKPSLSCLRSRKGIPNGEREWRLRPGWLVGFLSWPWPQVISVLKLQPCAFLFLSLLPPLNHEGRLLHRKCAEKGDCSPGILARGQGRGLRGVRQCRGDCE